MRRAVACVATTEYYQRGMARLRAALPPSQWRGSSAIPGNCPAHQERPYAFKAFSLNAWADAGMETLLWADACILPVRDMTPLWERIERDGYWFSENGWNNYEWTADSAYPELGVTREQNRGIPHVVATTFGISMRHEIGRAFLAEYFRLASETRAFCGPWSNAPETPCGPSDVRGHRHDQTCASVIAWRLGMKLTQAPDIFAYKGGETEKTILVADGSYS